MRVLFFSWEYPPHGTGVGGYIQAMGRALTVAGHDVVIVTGAASGMPAIERTDAGDIHRLYGIDEVGSRSVAKRVMQIARDARVDWIEGADHLGEAATLARWVDRPPLLIKAHSCNPLRVLRESEIRYAWQRPLVWLALLRQWKRYCAERRSFEVADLLLVPSQRMRHEVAQQGLRNDGAIRIVPNPVVPCEAGRCESPVPTLLYVGRLSFGKGIEYLPSILRQVKQVYPDAVLELAGNDSYARGLGSLRNWLEHKMGHDIASVRFLGSLSSAELDKTYRRAWVVVVPSRWDSFSNVTLEAMAREVPVVASPHGGMPELLASSGSPVADPTCPVFARRVCELLGDRGKREDIGKRLRLRAIDKYYPGPVVDHYLRLVAEIL